jgi:hypothetical protein
VLCHRDMQKVETFYRQLINYYYRIAFKRKENIVFIKVGGYFPTNLYFQEKGVFYTAIGMNHLLDFFEL